MYKKIISGLLIIFVFQACSLKQSKYVFNEGLIFGTFYHLTYENPSGKALQQGITEELERLNMSLSTFNDESVISKINSNQEVELDEFFLTVFNKSKEISALTNGAFDPTVAPFVNVWGFGFKKKESITSELIDSIKQFVGIDKIRLKNGEIVKDDLRLMLDFSAIAKGYAADIVGNYLAKNGCENYMVEIGGEVVAHGVNKEGKLWRIGINEPNDNEPIAPSDLQAVVSLDNNKAIATSGNYRNFYIENGVKYAHTISPKTGYPVIHSLLSASVLANDCMTADAFATACMVIGLDNAMELANKLAGIEAFLIYAGEDGSYKTIETAGFSDYVLEEK